MVRCIGAGVLLALLPGCAALVAKKHTYDGVTGVDVNGAKVSLRVKPEGTDGGNYALSAMVVSAAVATLDGPFRWKIEAIGVDGVHESLVVHRVHTHTTVTQRDEWYPSEHLGKRAEFRRLKGESGKSRAIYEIPGTLEVKPREDGALEIVAEISVRATGKTRRERLKFRLDPTEKRQDEFIFLPAEIVRSIGTDPADWENPGWD